MDSTQDTQTDAPGRAGELRQTIQDKVQHSHNCEDVLIGGFPCICGAVDEVMQLIDAATRTAVTEALLKRLKDFRLAWSSQLPFEVKDSLDFQIAELEAVRAVIAARGKQ